MNAIQNRKVHNIEKSFPGCLGRMVNLFDLSTGVAGNRLLTDRPHCDGPSLSRSQSDVARMLSPPFGDHIEEKQIVPELSKASYDKANRTPIKMLIAQELSKEGDSRHNPPNVVAKLMGLDTLPRQQSDSAAVRSHSKGYSRRSLSHSGVGCWQQEDGFLDKGMQSEYMGSNECRDVYEIWQQSQKANCVREKSPQKIRYSENINEKKMDLVRQKFLEAKRLATDDKLRQSKEFHEALEVLSSNKDLFLKFLQEPNSLFSQHLYDMQSIPPPPETKRITVLRPSKMVDEEKLAGLGKKIDKPIKKPAQAGQVTGWDKSNMGYSSTFANHNVEEYHNQPTRIVVLKPTPGKTHDIKAVVSLPSPPPRILPGEDLFEETEDDEARESREVAKEITRQVRENFMGHRRDETLLSSVFSNGYIGDESSFNKSENEYTEGNLSDSEVMSPTSRYSWDYLNRFGSPFSSSFSRASCSPESSVCREAKKRLSERWAMMASNGSSVEQKHVRRSSSTLGEMLALSDSKKLVKSKEDDNCGDQEPRGSISILTSDVREEEDAYNSPINLLRSKSLPVTSTVYGSRLNAEASDHEVGKSLVPMELTKAKSMKSSLKGKVSSLFFSRSKRLDKERSSASQSKDESQSSTTEAVGSLSHPHVISASPLNNGGALEKYLTPGLCGEDSLDLIGMEQKQSIVSQEAGISVAKPVGNVYENLDQPSPISVLEPPFEEDYNAAAMASSGCIKLDQRGIHGSIHPKQSNLIDKSPPIGSIARTLSWDDSCTEVATPYPLGPLATSGTMEEEQEWLASVRMLLSTASVDGEVRSDSFFARWHSPDSPLDPSLRDKYANLIEEPLHEGKRRQRRSNRKLVFDCVNAALAAEISSYGSDNRGTPEGTSANLADRVWARIKEWFYSEEGCCRGEEYGGDMNSLVVDRVVRKELVGNGWVEHMRLQVDNVGKEIEGKLLQELVEEAVVDLTDR